MDKIAIDKLVVFGNHGVYEAENTLGQKFVVSAVLYVDTRKAGMSDELECSINYGEVSQYIVDFFAKNTFKLIESVAEKLAEEGKTPLLFMQDDKVCGIIADCNSSR